MNTVTYARLRKIASESQAIANMLYPGSLQYINGRHKPRELERGTDFDVSRLSDPDYVLADAMPIAKNYVDDNTLRGRVQG